MATKTKQIKSDPTPCKASLGVVVGKPTTMDELLRATGYVLKGFRRGETVKGKVAEVTGRSVYVNIGGKSEAIVAEQEFDLARDYFRSLKIGDEVTGVVLIAENDAGQVVLSLRRAAVDSKWKKYEDALANEEIITVHGKEATKGGLLVEDEGVYGFVPASQFSKEIEDPAKLAGMPIKVKVIEVDRQQNRLVLSEKAVSEAEEIEKRRKALSSVKVEGEYEGTVAGLVPFGAFVEVDVGKAGVAEKLEGLVHISEISWEKIEDVSKVVKEGEKVKVVVIGIDEDNGKLALSIKRLTEDPWSIMANKYKNDTKHAGEVTRITPYGILVKMERGIEGLIHASKMPVDRVFQVGEHVNVFVESVDLDKRRLSLGVVLTEKPVGYK